MPNALSVGIIGSGVGGLFCGAWLAKSKKSIEVTVFEQGPYVNERCPKKYLTSCNNCTVCSVTNGLGGNALTRSVRLSTAPAGSKLINLLGSRYDLLEKTAIKAWLNAIKSYNKPQKRKISTSLKGYGAIELRRSENIALMNCLIDKINKKGKIQCNEMVQSLIKNDAKWVVKTKNKNYHFDKVIIAGGKCCMSTLENSLRLAGVTLSNGDFEYGVRIEFPSFPSSIAAKLPKDNKLKIFLDNGVSARTYCWSYPGKSVIVHNFGINCLDGDHNNKDTTRLSFAVLVRINSAADDMRKTYLNKISANFLRLTNGHPIAQSLKAFMNINDTSHVQRLEVPDNVVEGRLSALFGKELTAKLQMAIHTMGINYWPNSTNAIVLGPCIEKFYSIPVINNRHESDAKGIYFVGDSSGAYRGALQASIAGIDVANICME